MESPAAANIAKQAAKQHWESTVKSRSHGSAAASLSSSLLHAQQARSPSTGSATAPCAAQDRGRSSALLHPPVFHCQGGQDLLAPLTSAASSSPTLSAVENSLQGKSVLESTGLLD